MLAGDQAPTRRKKPHLGRPTQVMTKAAPTDIWRVRGSPGEVVQDDFDASEPRFLADVIDEECEEFGERPFFDGQAELPHAA